MNSPDLAGLLQRRQPNHSLDRVFYVDEDVFRHDLSAIWYREWLFVGHAAELPSAGDYVTVAIGDHQIVLIRGHDESIRALHNVCRHRGSLLCTEQRGSARRKLVCPYHQWAYDLDGRLTRSRGSSSDLEPAKYSLATAACEVLSGLIFICLADDPPDFAPVRDLAEPYLAPFDLAKAKIAAVSTTVEEANWKLVVENNRECLHCRSAHPELCVTFPEAPLHTGAATGDDIIVMQDLDRRARSLGLAAGFAIAPDHQFRAMRMPLLGSAVSMTWDGKPAVARRFGDLPDENLGEVLLYHYPSTWNHFMSDHAVTFRLLPLGPTQTLLTTTWLVPFEAVEGVDYEIERLTEVWKQTNSQDAELVRHTQLGVTSPAYQPGPYAPIDELGVTQFVDWYSSRMLAWNGDKDWKLNRHSILGGSN